MPKNFPGTEPVGLGNLKGYQPNLLCPKSSPNVRFKVQSTRINDSNCFYNMHVGPRSITPRHVS